MKSESVNHLVVSDSLWPHIINGILQVKILEWVAIPSSRGSSHPRDWTQISHIAGEFFTAEPLGKPKNAGVGSLSLLQGIFLTQKSNWGLLHCMWTLYQLSYQGIPRQWGDEVSGEGVRKQLFLLTMALLSCLKAALGDLLQVKSNLSFSRWVGVQEVPTELSPGKWVIYWEASKKKKELTCQDYGDILPRNRKYVFFCCCPDVVTGKATQLQKPKIGFLTLQKPFGQQTMAQNGQQINQDS